MTRMVTEAHALIEIPCGTLLARVSEKGLTRLTFLSEEEMGRWRRLQSMQSPTMLQRMNLDATKKWIQSYLERSELPLVKLDLEGSKFQKDVWIALRSTIPGDTLSYSQLAELAGHPESAREVGASMANNPICLIVPCHRVLKKDGEIGEYSGYGGQETKNWLIQHESEWIR